MSDWVIGKTTGCCAASGRQLAEGEHYYAVVFDRGETLERVDYSEECWEGPPEGALCSWRARIPRREERKRQFVDDQVLMDFFERLDGESEESKVQFRFVLTLILMRKRLLKYVRETDEHGAKWWIMRLMGPFKPQDDSKSERKVLNPELDESQIEEVSRQLGVILTGDFGDDDEPEQSSNEGPALRAAAPDDAAAEPAETGDADE
jgi:hypothetical protein